MVEEPSVRLGFSSPRLAGQERRSALGTRFFEGQVHFRRWVTFTASPSEREPDKTLTVTFPAAMEINVHSIVEARLSTIPGPAAFRGAMALMISAVR